MLSFCENIRYYDVFIEKLTTLKVYIGTPKILPKMNNV